MVGPARAAAVIGMLRRVGRVLLLLVVLALIAGTCAFLWWRGKGAPQREGRVVLASLATGVTVRFDDAAVPHVAAASLVDLSRAMGWLHANERMGQMELQRRYAAGRLSEIIGAATIGADRRMRELGIARAAQAQLRACSRRSREVLEAYAQGVNTWLDTHRGDLPPDLVLLRAEPEPWKPEDSLGIELLMAQMLSYSEERERVRMNWLGALGVQRASELIGVAGLEIAPELPEIARNAFEAARKAELEASGQNGSNNWAVAGSRSASAGALVANDPHLGLGLPSVWYQAQLRSPEYEATGFTLPGLPMVVIGQGRHVAWSFTNAELDVCDLFLERVREDGAAVERDGEWLAITSEREELRVRDGESVEVLYRATDIGPLLTTSAREPRLPFSLAWTAFVPFDPVEPFLALPGARSASEIPTISGRFVSPPQNLVAGDGTGQIVSALLGRGVQRGFGTGHLPLPAWKRSNHWQGLAPHEQAPSQLEPPSALIATANDDPRPAGFPFPYSVDSAAPQRGERIRQRLAERSDWTPELLARLQVDTTSLYARELCAALPEPPPGDAHRAWAALRSFGGEMTLLGPSALYSIFERELTLGIFGDELSKCGGIGHPERARARLQAVQGKLDARWFDDLDTPQLETRESCITAALERAWREGWSRWGDDVARWDYGAMHVWTPSHQLASVPVLGLFFSRGSHEVPGSDTSPCVFSGARVGERIEVGHGASLRFVADCADPDRSLGILPAGQSGHPFDAHYDDQIERYLAGSLRPMRWSEAAILAATVTTLELTPRP